MGTFWSARVVVDPADATADLPPDSVRTRIEAELALVNRLMSHYEESSELSRFGWATSTAGRPDSNPLSEYS